MYSQYRLSKYNPKYRKNDGYYIKDEWTEISEIGDKFDNIEFTLAEYLGTEHNYIQALIDILVINKISISSLRVEFSPNQSDYFQKGNEGNIIKYLHPGQFIENEIMFSEIIKPLLRYENWFRIENDEFFIHFGFDSYCYLGFFDISKTLIIPHLPTKIYLENCEGLGLNIKKQKRNLKYNPKTWKGWGKEIQKLERRLLKK